MRRPSFAGAPEAPLELWGGPECTLNRVGDTFLDQLELSGHDARPGDLERFAALGLRTLRYPILWERHCRTPDGPIDWSFADERLGLMRELGIRPVVGFVHHGSGPSWTSLLDPSFPEGLARFAARFAERYPWVQDYTPVNEPLTTARFSGLYGHWYPHRSDDASFARALLHQCQAVVRAMEAVRSVSPAARLVQTEDLGQIYSTALLHYQAEFENHRRWLSFDLLCGVVRRRHPLYGYLRRIGRIEEAALAAFAERPCPPDIIGINYYLTSDRFLDHRLGRYPAATHGGNGRHRYADVEAVRVRREGITGHQALLLQAWARYGLPLAITEVHVGCTREEQVRWLLEAWRGARAARAAGADVRAVVAWALLGSADWDSLVTRVAGSYEPGVFELRGGEPRETALASVVRALCRGASWDHPIAATPGWWRRSGRLLYPPTSTKPTLRPARAQGGAPVVLPQRPRPLLIAGGAGALGGAFGRACQERGLPCVLLPRTALDISDSAAVAATLEEHRPWAVINAAGSARIDHAEREPDACHRVHAAGAEVLADACGRAGLPLLTFSSAQVFDGQRRAPYRESDPVAPLSAYGRSKAEAERRVLARLPQALVVRTSAIFGPFDDRNFVTRALRALLSGRPVRAAADVITSPTYAPELVRRCLDLLIDGESGLWHVAGADAVSWAALARLAAERAGCDPGLVQECSARELEFVAPRPAYAALGSERGAVLGGLGAALGRYVQEGAHLWARADALVGDLYAARDARLFEGGARCA